ncbi:magnetosome protein MamT [Magnetococcales bacterium HHB-1]
MDRQQMKIWGLLVVAVLLVLVIALGLFGKEKWLGDLFSSPAQVPSRQLRGEILGMMPKPANPTMRESIVNTVAPKPLKRMVVKHIPQLSPGAAMPHPYWGPCTKCHLIRGGAPAGSQPATPVAKVWEKVSALQKVGPPILPNSSRPHPPSGRCIKCHDVVVQVKPR